jgi:heme exporter protein CcmD
MGGYGFYIWTSYGISAFVLIGLTFLSLRRLHQIEHDLQPLENERRALRTKVGRKREAP